MWLRKEALAVEETPNYLAAVKVKLNNPGMGKAGLWERHKSIFPRGSRRRGANAAHGLSGFPGTRGSRDVLAEPGQGWADELCPSISAHQAPRAAVG